MTQIKINPFANHLVSLSLEHWRISPQLGPNLHGFITRQLNTHTLVLLQPIPHSLVLIYILLHLPRTIRTLHSNDLIDNLQILLLDPLSLSLLERTVIRAPFPFVTHSVDRRALPPFDFVEFLVVFGVVGVDFCYLFLGMVIEGVTGALVGGGLKVVGGLVATEDVVDALEVL